MRRARRRPPILTVALGVLTVAAVAVAVAVVGTPPTSSARERTVTVRRGVVESTVSGSGNLAAKNEVNLDFASSGKVTHIYVHEGEKVVKGELLATIDPSSARVAVAQAQADLQSAQDTLSSVSSSSTTTTASTGTTAAVAYVAQANTPTTPTTTTPSTKKQSAPSSSSKQATTQPAASSSSSNGSSGSGTKTSYAAALAAVESAELSVKSAQAQLRATKIIAPAAATVAEVNGSVGETAGASSTGSSSAGSSSFIVLAQLQSFKMDVSLTESDIGKVRVGQAATVTVNAASGAEFSAHVASVGVLPTSSSSSTSSSSAVSYPVTLVLDQTGAGIKPGMSASADIITSRASGIVVPTEALNGSTVTVVRNGRQVSQQVQTGVAGDTTTQVLAGLRAGDQVVVRAATVNVTGGATNSSGAGARTGRFGGLGGGGGFTGGGGFAAGAGPPGGFPR